MPPTLSPTVLPTTCDSLFASDPTFKDELPRQACEDAKIAGACDPIHGLHFYRQCRVTCSGCVTATAQPSPPREPCAALEDVAGTLACTRPLAVRGFPDGTQSVLAGPGHPLQADLMCTYPGEEGDFFRENCSFTCAGCITLAPTASPTDSPTMAPSVGCLKRSTVTLYAHFDELATWDNAQAHCLEHRHEYNEQWTLAAITTEVENRRVAATLPAGIDQAWIGAYEPAGGEGNWLRPTARPPYGDTNDSSTAPTPAAPGAASFTAWAEGEPNNDHDSEHCAEIGPDGRWNDEGCGTRRSFVCSYRDEWNDPYFVDALPQASCRRVRNEGLCSYDGSAQYYGQCNVTCSDCAAPTAAPTRSPVSCHAMNRDPALSDTIGQAACEAIPDFEHLCMADATFMAKCTFTCSGCWTYAPSMTPTVSPTASPTASPSVSPSSSPTTSPSASPSASPSSHPTNGFCVERNQCTNNDPTDPLLECAALNYDRFDAPTTFWPYTYFGGQITDENEECCWDSDGDGHPDTNANPGGVIERSDRSTDPYAGWPQTLDASTCTSACWRVWRATCFPSPTGDGQCGGSSTARPICTDSPTTSPTTARPTTSPTENPTHMPSKQPSRHDCIEDILGTANCEALVRSYSNAGLFACAEAEIKEVCAAVCCPTRSPTFSPTTKEPTSSRPTRMPTASPSTLPTISRPTGAPTQFPGAPTSAPTAVPSAPPTVLPTTSPSIVPSTSPTNSPTTTTCDDNLDLMFLLDESSSITSGNRTENWESVLSFTTAITDWFNVGRILEHPNSANGGGVNSGTYTGDWRTKVGLVTFSGYGALPGESGDAAAGRGNSSYVHLALGSADDDVDLTGNSNSPAEIYDVLSSVPHAGGATFTDLGLQTVVDALIPETRDASRVVSRVLVVVTDGLPSEGHRAATGELAAQLKGDNRTTIITVVVGTSGELPPYQTVHFFAEKLSTSLTMTYTVAGYSSLLDVAPSIRELACHHAGCGLDVGDDCATRGLPRMPNGEMAGCFQPAVRTDCPATCCNFLGQYAQFLPTVSPSTSTPTTMPSAAPSTPPTPATCAEDRLGALACGAMVTAYDRSSSVRACDVPELAAVCGKTCCPTMFPTASPSTSAPTAVPTTLPTTSPSPGPTLHPTALPSASPVTSEPTTSIPTIAPTVSPTSARPTVAPTYLPTIAPTDEACASNLDLMFLVDESGPNTADGWQHTLDVIKGVSSEFDVGKALVRNQLTGDAGYTGGTRTRVSVGTFSSIVERPDASLAAAYTHIPFNAYTNTAMVSNADFETAVNGIERPEGIPARTRFTDDGLMLVQEEMIPYTRAALDNNDRTARVLVVFVNGPHADGHSPLTISQALRDNRTTVIVVPIGGGVSDVTFAAQTVSGTIDETFPASFQNDLGLGAQLVHTLRGHTCKYAICQADEAPACAREDCTGPPPLTTPSSCSATCCTMVTQQPSAAPTSLPSTFPTGLPSTAAPTEQPTRAPTAQPTTAEPTQMPTPASCLSDAMGSEACRLTVSSFIGTGVNPCDLPEIFGACGSTCCPTRIPTAAPSTSEPTLAPTRPPTASPTAFPTRGPTAGPTVAPTSSAPTPRATRFPTRAPTTSAPTSGPTPTPTWGPTRETCQHNLDLVFLLDESSSVSATGWQRTLNFVDDVTSGFTLGNALIRTASSQAYIGNLQTRVSVTTFSSYAARDDATVAAAYTHIPFAEYRAGNIISRGGFAQRLATISQAGGATFTDQGLQLVADELNETASRTSVSGDTIARIVVVLADEPFTINHNPSSEADALRASKTAMIGVAIGDGGSPESLIQLTTAMASSVSKSVAGTVDNTFMVNSHTDLGLLVPSFTANLCERARCGPDTVSGCIALVEDRSTGTALSGCSQMHQAQGEDKPLAAWCPATCCFMGTRTPSSSPTPAPSAPPTMASALPMPAPTMAPTCGVTADISAFCTVEGCCALRVIHPTILSYCAMTCCDLVCSART